MYIIKVLALHCLNFSFPDLNLEKLQLEFNALPSGLHLVEKDVVYVFLPFALIRGLKLYSYFSKENQHGVCVFHRRQTQEHGHRGFRLSSLGIILAKSLRPRPWRHVKALKSVIDSIYLRASTRANLDLTEEDWEPARLFFEERKVRRADLGGVGDWMGWSNELDGV